MGARHSRVLQYIRTEYFSGFFHFTGCRGWIFTDLVRLNAASVQNFHVISVVVAVTQWVRGKVKLRKVQAYSLTLSSTNAPRALLGVWVVIGPAWGGEIAG